MGSLALGGALRVIPFTLLGTYFAWAYLRFLQSNSGVRWALCLWRLGHLAGRRCPARR